jgi:hypothetical protein
LKINFIYSSGWIDPSPTTLINADVVRSAAFFELRRGRSSTVEAP